MILVFGDNARSFSATPANFTTMFWLSEGHQHLKERALAVEYSTLATLMRFKGSRYVMPWWLMSSLFTSTLLRLQFSLRVLRKRVKLLIWTPLYGHCILWHVVAQSKEALADMWFLERSSWFVFLSRVDESVPELSRKHETMTCSLYSTNLHSFPSRFCRSRAHGASCRRTAQLHPFSFLYSVLSRSWKCLIKAHHGRLLLYFDSPLSDFLSRSTRIFPSALNSATCSHCSRPYFLIERRRERILHYSGGFFLLFLDIGNASNSIVCIELINRPLAFQLTHLLAWFNCAAS